MEEEVYVASAWLTKDEFNWLMEFAKETSSTRSKALKHIINSFIKNKENLYE